jgi:hypothetical protein
VWNRFQAFGCDLLATDHTFTIVALLHSLQSLVDLRQLILSLLIKGFNHLIIFGFYGLFSEVSTQRLRAIQVLLGFVQQIKEAAFLTQQLMLH